MPTKPTHEISPQRRYQLARKSEGKCGQCGIAAILGYTRCPNCHESDLRRHRERGGKFGQKLNPWKPGGPGRPPKRGIYV